MFNCLQCKWPMTKKELSTTEAIDHEVDMILCSLCGYKFYIMRGSFKIPSYKYYTRHRYYCQNCSVRTAGVVSNKDAYERRCPICQRPLNVQHLTFWSRVFFYLCKTTRLSPAVYNYIFTNPYIVIKLTNKNKKALPNGKSLSLEKDIVPITG